MRRQEAPLLSHWHHGLERFASTRKAQLLIRKLPFQRLVWDGSVLPELCCLDPPRSCRGLPWGSLGIPTSAIHADRVTFMPKDIAARCIRGFVKGCLLGEYGTEG
ncbi:hypothetical protein GOP47_0023756 [Adiantum capillus-veneris]|nr:hypothetical protein GOP47_0023756 [Adiantum capillus-veneris]